ncbi:MAG: hypothetical protein C5B47_06385 [Verrucomicrobia bacterium]|nr:MAG: hypothetical protein C5B47_06385 [Verrucomicrobiota bacterium]
MPLTTVQLATAYEEWSGRREGPPPVLPPRCLSTATLSKIGGGKYSDAFGDDGVSLACMVTLAYITRQPTSDPNVYTCALPSGERLRQQNQSNEVKKAKQAATRVENAQLSGDVAEARKAVIELRQIVDRALGGCLQA